MSKWIAAFAVGACMAAAPALAAPRVSGEAKLQQLLKGHTPGKPVSCVSQTPSMTSTTIEGIGIVYRRGSTLYVNRFDQGCPSLNTFNTIVTRTPSNQLCRGDIARIVDLTTRMEGGSCVFSEFTPYERTK